MLPPPGVTLMPDPAVMLSAPDSELSVVTPPEPDDAMVMPPLALVMVTLAPAVRVLSARRCRCRISSEPLAAVAALSPVPPNCGETAPLVMIVPGRLGMLPAFSAANAGAAAAEPEPVEL
jgi:hypothetical protein